jgi:hypothetical protein
MYPLLCPGGYGVPVTGARVDVIGVRAAVSSPASASRLILLDDPDINGDNFGRILSDTAPYDNYSGFIVDVKGVADVDGNLEVLFPEPIRLRYGISVAETTNLVPGSIMVYQR